tara:strand:- start:916 stop:1101 length:186 start_codon:yes stop_codon:yes gene_type:complete
MKRDIIPICSVHEKFQTVNGRWLDKGEDFAQHIAYSKSQEAFLMESPCDQCDDPKQLNLKI